MIQDQIKQISKALADAIEVILIEHGDYTPETKKEIAVIVNEATDRIEKLKAQLPAERERIENGFRSQEIFSEKQEPPTEQPLPSGIDLLWQISRGNVNAFVNYLNTVPDPALNSLLKNPEQLQQTINQLTQQVPIEQEEDRQGIPQADLQSSNIFGFRYDNKRKRLYVRFQNGGLYEYASVPRQIFQQFAQGAVPAKTTGQNEFGKWWNGKEPSLGAAFYELIRNGGYKYQKLR